MCLFIGPYEDLLTSIKKRKLRWYGHVTRNGGLAKTILQGTVQGGRKRGRQKKRWEDDIKEWTGLSFSDSQRAAQDRDKWRVLVSSSRWCPNDPTTGKGIVQVVKFKFNLEIQDKDK